ASQIFKIVDLDCILQLQLSEWWFEFMAHLFPYLGQMRNLHTLVLQGIKKLFIVDASAEQEWISMLHSLFSKLPHLRNLHVISTHFLTGSLEEWLR
ncbi:preferentially expressed antigen in melanoma like 6, partial [Sigmodon hispidus]